MKKCFWVFVCLISISALGQEDVLSFQILEFERLIKNVENYSLSNSETGELVVVLGLQDKIRGYLFSKDFKKIDEIAGKHLTKTFENVIGYSVSNNKYTLVFSSNNKKKFAYVSFDFDTKVSETVEIESTFKDEKFLKNLQYKNDIILLTASKENELVLRRFIAANHFEEIGRFQLDKEDDEQQLRRGFDIFQFNKNTKGNLTYIDSGVPVSIGLASAENKIYLQGDTVYLTFEDEEEYTILHSINLGDLTLKTSYLEYPLGQLDEFKKYNSFIYDQFLFQIGTSKEEFSFHIKDFQGAILQQFYADSENEILFKNSKLNYIRGEDKKEITSTKNFLRRLSGGNLGLTVKSTNDNYVVKIGAAIISQGGGVISGGFGGYTAVGKGMSTASFNPVYFSYGGYSNGNEVSFLGLFDKNFDHITEKFIEDENVFDRIEEHQESLEWCMADDVFIHNDKTYFSYWDAKNQQYNMLQF